MRLTLLFAAALAVGALGVASHLASAAPSPSRADDLMVGLTVPWAVGGPRVESDGAIRDFPGEWPTIPFQSIRLWDGRTAWLNIEPRNDQWDFRHLDRFVAKARTHGVEDISLVLGGTPRWAAKQVRPTDADWMGAGSASPPKRMADWADFVTTVAERYRGLVTSYEIWNEPNNITFWSGTRAQWASLVQVAAARIRAADPQARIVASGFKMASVRDVAKVAPWISALRAVVPAVDNVSLHWYPDSRSALTDVRGVLASIASQSRAAGIVGAPWVTELNVRDGASLSAVQQAAAVRTLTAASRAGGAERITWYAWTDLGPPELMPLYPRTPAAEAVAALIPR